MTPSHRSLALISLFIVCGIITSGCLSSTHSQQFRMAFLPPERPGSPAAEPVLPEPPRMDTDLYLKEDPNLLARMPIVPKPSDADFRIKTAEDHFAAGKKAYQEERYDDARTEFNRAIDILLAAPENAPDREKLETRLEQFVDAIFHYDMEGLGAGESEDKVTYDKSPLEGMLEMTFPVDPGLKSKVMAEIQATASELPLEQQDSVLSYINFFSSERGHKVLAAGLRRAGRYQAMIERILAEEGIPEELVHVAQAESGFLPRAVSRKSAAGLWQFVQFRGREYGLAQTASTDDRLDPEQATRAAARHLHDLYNHFGDWYLAIAAYNCGPGCVDHAVERTGYADFWKLRSLDVLPRETANYVPLILAMTIMAKNPKDYGLEGVEPEPPLEYSTLHVTAPTSLALIADLTDRPLADLREMNPALLRPVAPAGYSLRVPKGTLPTINRLLQAIPAEHRAAWRMHRVNRGETLAMIAKRYGMPASSIAAVNRESLNAPSEGDVVIIPAVYREKAPRRYSTARSRGHHTAAANHRRTVSKKRVATRKVAAKPARRRTSAKTVATASLH